MPAYGVGGRGFEFAWLIVRASAGQLAETKVRDGASSEARTAADALKIGGQFLTPILCVGAVYRMP